jgi:hypothetical protein
MKYLPLWVLLLLSLWFGSGLAGELREFELHDGTILTGELLSVRDGVYTLKSPSLGTITLEASKVRAMRLHTPTNVAPAPQSPGQPTVEAQIQRLQQTMLGDAAIMQLLTSLLNDPEIQTLLADPTIMQAVQSQDFNTLLTHPKMQQLLLHPTVRDISKRLMQE